MINFYHRLATVFFPMRFIILAVAVVSLATGAFILLGGEEAHQRLMKPLLIAGIWLLLLASISYFFAAVPDHPTEDSGMIQQWISRCKRWLCGFFAGVFTLITVVTLFLGAKTLLMGS